MQTHALSTKWLSLLIASALVGVAALSFSAFQASADQDPGGCFVNAVGLGLAVYRSDGTTPVGGGTVTPGETVKYEASLFHSGNPTHCNFGGGSGTLEITTPDGVMTDVTGGGIPLVSSGNPFTSAQVSYVVDSGDVVGGSITAEADYANGISHTGVTHSIAEANNNISTPFDLESPELSTTQQPASALVGDLLNDDATLSGGFNPTGTITFNLYNPSDASCEGTPDYTEDVDVDNGNDTYSTSPGHVADVAEQAQNVQHPQ